MTDHLPAELDDASIDEAVDFINDRFVAHVYNGYLEIGAYVLEKFFNNDLSLARSRNRTKPVSYQKLCIHSDLMVSRTALMDMVNTAAQHQFLIDGGIRTGELLYSILVLLTRLENNDEKLALARECIDEGLLVEDVRIRIQEIKDQSSAIPAAPAIAVKKYLGRANRWVRGMEKPAGMTNRNVINSMAPADREKILDAAGGLLEDISVITNAIRELVAILIETPNPALPEIEPPASGEA